MGRVTPARCPISPQGPRSGMHSRVPSTSSGAQQQLEPGSCSPSVGRTAPRFAAAPLAALSAPGSVLGLFFLKVSLRRHSDWPFFPDDAPG